jgi:hypothetical protein
MKVVPVCRLECTWWKLFQSVDLSVPDESCSSLSTWVYLMNVVPVCRLECTWWKLFQSVDFEHTWWKLFQSVDFEHTWWKVFQSVDFERTWWKLFQSVDFERTWWKLFQSVDFERTWWKLFQQRVVYTKFDIYVFIIVTGFNICDHMGWFTSSDTIGEFYSLLQYVLDAGLTNRLFLASELAVC